MKTIPRILKDNICTMFNLLNVLIAIALAAAAKVAETAGIKSASHFIDISTVPDDEIEAAAEKYTVFGKVSPKQKKELVAALQKVGHKVAMLGDGVNDLLAMRRADASVAMGNGSTAQSRRRR